MSNNHSKQRERFRLSGLILGLIGAALGLPVFFLWGIPRFQQVRFDPQELTFMFLVIIRWIEVGFAWKWALIFGVVLIFDSVFLAIFLREWPLGILLFFCGLILASGVLFILSWLEGRKRN